jgi:hypothetical protein
VVYVGSPLFKILRLIIIAIFSIHLFACIFYRVKEVSAVSQDDVTAFYVSKNVDEGVSWADGVYKPCWYGLLGLTTLIRVLRLDEAEYLLQICEFFFAKRATDIPSADSFLLRAQLVCFYYVITTFTTVGYGAFLEIFTFPMNDKAHSYNRGCNERHNDYLIVVAGDISALTNGERVSTCTPA